MLSEDGRRVALLDPASGESVSLDLTRIAGPGWSGEKALISGAGAAFLIDGTIGTERGFLLLDRDGNLLAKGSWRDGLAPDLLAAAGDDLARPCSRKRAGKGCGGSPAWRAPAASGG